MITSILNIINMQETHFIETTGSFNNTYKMGEMPEEWKTVLSYSYTTTVENYKGINACCTLYGKILNAKFKGQAGKFLLECQNGFWKGISCIDPLFSTKVHKKRAECNLETHLTFIDYVNAFYRVKREIV